MKHKCKQVLLDRLPLLDTGKGYPDWDHVSLRSVLYPSVAPLTRIRVLKNTDREFFPAIKKRIEEFKDCKIGDTFGPSWSTQWFILDIDMPEDWGENEEIHLMWDSDSEGLLYTSEGGILQGFLGEDSDRKRYVYIMKRDKVRNDFVDGKVQYFIEMSCMKFKGCTFEDGADTWPLGVNMDEYFPLKVAQIAIFNREAWDILYDYIVVKDSALLLEPTMSSRADEALVTANRMTDICSPLDNTTYPKTHLEAERFLSSPNSSAQHEVYAVGHCHIDAGWLWPFWETHRKTARSWSCQMRLFENYPQFNFCNSSAIFYEWMKADYPDLFAEIKSRHAEGRFEVVGGTYLEMDGNLPSGESFARQFLYGQRFFKANFGKYLEVFFMPDTFGYSAQLPQYMAQSKIKYFMTNKISWNVFNTFPHTTFYWEGIDGSKVFSHFPPARGCSLHGEVAEVLKSQTQNLDKGRTNKSLFLFGLGDGGGGPHDYMIERLTRMSDCCGIPKVHFSSVLKFFEDAQATAHDLFTWQGELYLEKHNGTYTTIAKNKKNNRECEYLVRDMEYLSSLEFFYTGNYPQALLDRIWKDMMKDQFHDVIPGTSISMIYDITDKDYASIREKTESNITNSTLAVLQEAVGVSNPLSFVDTEGEGNAYSLLNTGMHEREYLYWSEADSAYKNINVGGLTAHVITKSDVDALPVIQGQVKVTEGEGTLLVENDYYLITFTTEGRVSSLLDKETGEYALESTYRENIAPPTLQSSSYLQHGNTFCIHQDTPPMWDAWDVWIYNLDTHNLLKANNYSYVHKGHILQLTFNITISDKSTITQVVTVAKDSRRIDFHTQVEWHEMHKWLRVYFPLNVYADHATFDIQGGLLSRTTTTNTSWDVAKYEVCAHHFGDISDNEYGFALLNNCKYGYSARANVLGLSLLKSSKGPWDQADMGIHNFTYSIYPHIGPLSSTEILKEAEALNTSIYRKYLKMTTPISKEISWVSVDKSNIKIDCMKLDAETNKNLVIRLHEHLGKLTSFKLTLNLGVFGKAGIKEGYITDFIEDKVENQGPLLQIGKTEGEIVLKAAPYKSLTLMLVLE